MAMAASSTLASALGGRSCLAWKDPCAARAGAPAARNLSVGLRDMTMLTRVRFSSASPQLRVPSASPRILCQASEKDTVSKARKNQMEATELLAELLKTDDVKAIAEKHVESLSQDFFIIASTYLDLLVRIYIRSPTSSLVNGRCASLNHEYSQGAVGCLCGEATKSYLPHFWSRGARKAKKEGNLEVVSKLETTLQTALSVKEATLRPEIRLLNQLLRETAEKDRANTIQANLQCLAPDSYFYQLVTRMISDVESQKSNPNRLRLLTQLRMINKETREVAKAMRKKGV
ncbi:hypothetical protein AXG93_1160s1010 [Marchantia polymorpha subsp. ruderalis]|uniref:Uncharacterized protein n=1 Tax=Marchantia polymorpha subsp. ruderalis TaxID=1480154 RepID=A0A176VP44_MARPO|nr:hypothetical protein AXG93_1160s1010 [Marchantia polymorpha subsp. ruderalis]